MTRRRRLAVTTIGAITASMALVGTGAEAVGCSLGTTSGVYGNGYAVATEADIAQIGGVCGMTSIYYLTADITMTAPTAGQSNHTPIGTDGNRFNGYLLGQGHTIDGLVIEGGTANDVGFFGVLGDSSGVEEITFTNATVTGGDRVGIVAGHGYMLYPFDVTIEGTVTGANEVGGMFGRMYRGSAYLVTADVTVTGTGSTGLVGGIVGACTGSASYGVRLEEIDVTATVESAGDDVGGICGATSIDTDIKKFVADVTVSGDGDRVGGVTGSAVGLFSGLFEVGNFGTTSTLTGTVTGGGDYVGGLVGRAEMIYTKGTFDVSVDVVMTGTEPSYAGGIFGYSRGGDMAAQITYSGDVSAPTATNVGGIFGANAGLLGFYGSPVVTGTITGKTAVGGIAGMLNGGGLISQSDAAMTVVGTTDVGGIVGLLDGTPFDMGGYTGIVAGATLTSSKSSGAVTGTTNVGGVVGRTLDASVLIENVYSTATVTGTTDVGGLLGKADTADGAGAATVKNSYAAGVTTPTGGTADPLVGAVHADTVFTADDLYFDTDRTGLATSAHGTAGDDSTLTQFSTFDTAGWSIADGWSNAKAWGICGPQNDGYPFLVWEVANANACLEAPAWTDDVLADLVVGEPLDDGVAASGSAPITYAISAGTLPDGLALDTATGAITGTPTTAGAYDFTVSATNAAGSITVQFTGTLTYPDPDVNISLEFGIGANIRTGDQTTTVYGSGLKPNSAYTVVLRSDPVTIGSGTADAYGRFEAELIIPANTPAGSHSATVYGIAPDGTPMSDVSYFTLDDTGAVLAVSADAPTPPWSTLPETGSTTGALTFGAALALVTAGWSLMRIGRRPRGRMATARQHAG